MENRTQGVWQNFNICPFVELISGESVPERVRRMIRETCSLTHSLLPFHKRLITETCPISTTEQIVRLAFCGPRFAGCGGEREMRNVTPGEAKAFRRRADFRAGFTPPGL